MDLDHDIVFIGGLHRSGTSLLHESLRSHPDISGFSGTGVWEDEGQHLQTVMSTARAHGGPGRFALDPAAHLTEASPKASPEYARKLLAEWAPYWDQAKPMWIEKSPPNLIRTRYLQALFPHARFVMVMRHPVDTSLATRRKWPGSPQLLYRQLAHWFRAYEVMSADLKRLERARVVRYEDFCRDPGGVLADLAGFLGLDDRFDRPAVDPGARARYLVAWQEMRSSPRYAAYTRALELGFASRARTSGYSMRPLV